MPHITHYLPELEEAERFYIQGLVPTENVVQL